MSCQPTRWDQQRRSVLMATGEWGTTLTVRALVSAFGVDLDQCAALRRAAFFARENVAGQRSAISQTHPPLTRRRSAPPFFLPGKVTLLPTCPGWPPAWSRSTRVVNRRSEMTLIRRSTARHCNGCRVAGRGWTVRWRCLDGVEGHNDRRALARRLSPAKIAPCFF